MGACPSASLAACKRMLLNAQNNFQSAALLRSHLVRGPCVMRALKWWGQSDKGMRRCQRCAPAVLFSTSSRVLPAHADWWGWKLTIATAAGAWFWSGTGTDADVQVGRGGMGEAGMAPGCARGDADACSTVSRHDVAAICTTGMRCMACMLRTNLPCHGCPSQKQVKWHCGNTDVTNGYVSLSRLCGTASYTRTKGSWGCFERWEPGTEPDPSCNTCYTTSMP